MENLLATGFPFVCASCKVTNIVVLIKIWFCVPGNDDVLEDSLGGADGFSLVGVSSWRKFDEFSLHVICSWMFSLMERNEQCSSGSALPTSISLNLQTSAELQLPSFRACSAFSHGYGWSREATITAMTWNRVSLWRQAITRI